MSGVMPVQAMKALLAERGRTVEQWLQRCLTDLADRGTPDTLRTAMEYSLMAGGKRLRPVLCLSTAALCGQKETDAILPFAAAIEMIHTYSLIHDDLPAMDDDDLRRGKPSNHKFFGEATAILAGDALLTDAFAFMCSVPLMPQRVVRAVEEFAKAAGGSGMVGGQALDMAYTGTGTADLDSLRYMHAMKTGALIRASCVCGGLLAGATETTVAALGIYGAALGVAFQIADDILDMTADTTTLGKPAGSDEARGKCTYPALVGLERSRQLACAARDEALCALHTLDDLDGRLEERSFLRSLTEHVVSRTF